VAVGLPAGPACAAAPVAPVLRAAAFPGAPALDLAGPICPSPGGLGGLRPQPWSLRVCNGAGKRRAFALRAQSPVRGCVHRPQLAGLIPRAARSARRVTKPASLARCCFQALNGSGLARSATRSARPLRAALSLCHCCCCLAVTSAAMCQALAGTAWRKQAASESAWPFLGAWAPLAAGPGAREVMRPRWRPASIAGDERGPCALAAAFTRSSSLGRGAILAHSARFCGAPALPTPYGAPDSDARGARCFEDPSDARFLLPIGGMAKQ